MRLAARALVRSPAFTAVAVLTLALGIGITTAMFAIVDALVLRPAPFRDADRLAQIFMGGDHGGRQTVTAPVLRAWQESAAFDGAESALSDTALIATDDAVSVRRIAFVTPGIFDLLGGVRPILGRLFIPGEGRAGADDRVLLSEGAWRSLYGADPAIIGRTITVDGAAATVVGVLPSRFRFPSWDTAIWKPVDFAAPPAGLINDRPLVYARFTSSMPRADAIRIATDAARATDPANAALRLWVRPPGDRLDPYYQRAVPLMSGAVVLVFLVLCANVSSLLLARLTGRRREFATCAALGASRARIMRQVFAETLLMGVSGAAIGMSLAWLLVSIARAFLAEGFLLRTLHPLDIDGRALVVASLAGMFATLAAGLAPAWMATGGNVEQSLRAGNRGGTESPGARTAMRGLLVGEIALACVLLVGAMLLVRSFVNLSNADRGLDARGVLTVRMDLRSDAPKDEASRAATTRVIEEAVQQLPGVRQLAWSYGLAPAHAIVQFGVWQSDIDGASGIEMEADQYPVGPGFFEVYGIPLLSGRTFTTSDPGTRVIVGERLAQRLWPGLDPVGRRFRIRAQSLEVIGLVKEIHYPSLNPGLDLPEFYQPFDGIRSMATLSIRCQPCPDPSRVLQRVATSTASINVYNVKPLEDYFFEQLARPRATAALAFAFAVIAALAAAAGLFSVFTYAVGRRRREFGIRTALGASAAQIRRLVFRDGLAVVVPGIAAGTAGAWLLARSIGSLQYGVSISDPIGWAIVLGLLAATATAAIWRPAREAARADPLLLLRED